MVDWNQANHVLILRFNIYKIHESPSETSTLMLFKDLIFPRLVPFQWFVEIYVDKYRQVMEVILLV
jgi:hypothetical protein